MKLRSLLVPVVLVAAIVGSYVLLDMPRKPSPQVQQYCRTWSSEGKRLNVGWDKPLARSLYDQMYLAGEFHDLADFFTVLITVAPHDIRSDLVTLSGQYQTFVRSLKGTKGTDSFSAQWNFGQMLGQEEQNVIVWTRKNCAVAQIALPRR